MADPAIARIHHVGIVVDDLEEACRLLRDGFGLAETGRVVRDELNAVFFATSGGEIELIEVIDEVARAERLGSARAVVEHVAFSVPDLDTTLAALVELGIELKAPPTTSRGARTAFTDAATSDGVMFQFVEEFGADA